MCSPSPKDESVEVEEPGVCSSSSDRPLTLHASDSVSELKQQRRERKPQNAQTPADISQQTALRRQRLQDLSLFGTLPEGEPDWFPGSLLSFRVTAGSEVGSGMAAWGALSRTVKSAGGKIKSTMLFLEVFFFVVAPISMRRPSDSLCGSDAVLLFTEATAYLS